MSTSRSLHDTWWRLVTQSRPASWRDALAAGALGFVAAGYGAAVAIRNAAYDRGWLRQVTLPARVISIGNLTVGGTGKTTCVQLVARKLQHLGCRVGVLSRGYGGARRQYWLRQVQGRLTVDGREGAPLDGVADEPRLLAAALDGVPVIVGPRRAETGRWACRELGCDALVLDDGFQHRRVRRDCDIVLVHARTPFGGWRLLPRGPMREPLTGLRRAHVIMITKADEAFETVNALQERLRALNPEAELVTAAHEPSGLLDAVSGARHDPRALAGMRVALVSSIGDPEGFEATVRRLQASIIWHRIFPDHHPFTTEEAAELMEEARRTRPQALVTTTKDWVRLQSAIRHPPSAIPLLWILEVGMKMFSGEEALDARLARVCAR